MEKLQKLKQDLADVIHELDIFMVNNSIKETDTGYMVFELNIDTIDEFQKLNQNIKDSEESYTNECKKIKKD